MWARTIIASTLLRSDFVLYAICWGWLSVSSFLLGCLLHGQEANNRLSQCVPLQPHILTSGCGLDFCFSKLSHSLAGWIYWVGSYEGFGSAQVSGCWDAAAPIFAGLCFLSTLNVYDKLCNLYALLAASSWYFGCMVAVFRGGWRARET